MTFELDQYRISSEIPPEEKKDLEEYKISPSRKRHAGAFEEIKDPYTSFAPDKVERNIQEFGKGILSGASLGASEYFDALKREEEGDQFPGTAGEAVGSLAPWTLAAKGVKYGLKGLNLASKYGPKFKYIDRFLHGASTGALVESGHQGGRAISGKETDLPQIPKTAAIAGSLEAIFLGGVDLWGRFKKISPQHQAQLLEQGIIPSGLPKSQYETAEEALRLISKRKPNIFPPGGEPPSSPGGSPPLKGRVSPEGEDLGLRPAPQQARPDLSDRIGNIFSRNKFYNSTQGGHALKNEIMELDQNVYRGVNELYGISRELNKSINEIHPSLVGRLQNRIQELRAIPEPSDVQKRLLRASENILERIAFVGENGEIAGLRPINNQILIDQVQSLRQIIDYDFSHGNTKNIFRPLINELQDSALNAARTSGAPEAAEAINDARSAYRAWVEAFDNDYVRPFRDASNQDYSKLFKSSLDFDEHNMLKRVLNTTPRGQELINGSTREIVEKHLAEYFENPRNANPKEFDKALLELEAVITPGQSQEIRAAFREAAERPRFRADRQLTNEEIIASKYAGKEPEDIQKMMDSRSGIKQLREDLSGSEQKKDIFNRISRQKMRSMIREGNIENDFTGDDLYKSINKQENYEIFSEILGESETESLRQAAKEIGKEQVKLEVRKKNLSKFAGKLTVLKTLELISGII